MDGSNERTRRYAVFKGLAYYPNGGIDDLTSTHDTLDEAVQAAKHDPAYEWAQVVDLCTLKEVDCLPQPTGRAYGAPERR